MTNIPGAGGGGGDFFCKVHIVAVNCLVQHDNSTKGMAINFTGHFN